MKRTATLSLILALFTSSLALAQSDGMKNMEKKDMGMQNSMDMKDMKGMDAQKCKDMMNGKGGKHPTKDAKAMTHKAVAVVKEVDAANGKVTLAHEAVKSLNWPPMTMGFTVKDKMLLDKLTVDKKVNVEFKKEGSDYVVTAVK
jgi:Cu/Ag efflux protein CusF